METKFQTWLVQHAPDDKMLWKGAFWTAYVFWRDRIIPMFNPIRRTWDDYDKTVDDIDAFTDIIGEHGSKSIINPVLKITYKETTIAFRYNFYDYEVAVISDKNLILPMNGLFQSETASFFYQGFPKEFQLTGRYESNQKQFMASIDDHYLFFTFMFLLKNELNKD